MLTPHGADHYSAVCPPFGASRAQVVTFRSTVFSITALAAVYVAAAKFGFAMALTAEQVALVWPPTGLSLAALLLVGVEVWPGIFLGALLANISLHEPLLVAVCIAAGSTLEAVFAARVMRRVVGAGQAINWLRYAIGLVLFGAVASTAISATIGVVSLCAGGLQPWSAFTPLWWRWWLGGAGGDLLIAPVLLTWRARPRIRTMKDALDMGLLAACLAAVGAAVFTRRFVAAAPYPLEYTVFPLVIWAAIRFGIAGVSMANLLIAGIAVWGTVHGFGPYAAGQGDERLVLMQVFMGIVAGSGLILGATISERDASRARKTSMLDAALDCIVTIDHLGQILEFNPAAERTFGYRRDEVLGREMADVIIPSQLRERYRHGLAEYNRSGASHFIGHRFESVALRANGAELPVEISITRVPVEGPPVFMGFLRDITAQKKIARQLAFRATHDDLTKALNRAAFMERLTLAVRQLDGDGHKTIAVLFVDLDKFKSINDRFGHAIGDRLLVATARRLLSCVRPGDSVARLGGDEFVVLLETVPDAAAVSAVARRIQQALDCPFNIGAHEIDTSASVGVALGSQPGPKPEDLLRAADEAMYRAKSLGER